MQENLFEKRMEAVNRAKENTRKKFHTAEEIVELLTDKELTISDVKNVLEIVYDMAMKMGAPVIGLIDCAGIKQD